MYEMIVGTHMKFSNSTGHAKASNLIDRVTMCVASVNVSPWDIYILADFVVDQAVCHFIL